MPTVYTRNMNQMATYWPPGAQNETGGTSFGAPVSVACRWQDVLTLVRDASGRQVTSEATVYVDRALLSQGYLYQGSSVVSDPREVAGARIILNVGSSPSLRNDLVLHKVWL